MSKILEAQLLLTPALRAKVLKKTEECLKLASKKFKREFEMPEIRYDIKNHDGGRAYTARNLIRYNLILLVENEKHFIENVVPHEVAHIINRLVNKPAPGKKRLMPHGREWKDIMTDLLKVDANVKHTYDCSSIEKAPKRKRVKVSIDRVQRILRQISRLTQEEHLLLNIKLDQFSEAA
jgi:predicted SprT family Zn-dependent metalloprotease